jgi:hypothetical protein
MIITDTQDHRQQRERHAHIIGWGADLDHANRPAYPMERTPPRLPHAVPPPEQQHSHAESAGVHRAPRTSRRSTAPRCRLRA